MSMPFFWIQMGEKESLPWRNFDSLFLSSSVGQQLERHHRENREELSGSTQSSWVPWRQSHIVVLLLAPVPKPVAYCRAVICPTQNSGGNCSSQVSHQSFMWKMWSVCRAGSSNLPRTPTCRSIRSLKAINRLWNPTDMGSETCSVTLSKYINPLNFNFFRFNVDILLLLYVTTERVNE